MSNAIFNISQLRVCGLNEAAALHIRYVIAHHNKYENKHRHLTNQPAYGKIDQKII